MLMCVEADQCSFTDLSLFLENPKSVSYRSLAFQADADETHLPEEKGCVVRWSPRNAGHSRVMVKSRAFTKPPPLPRYSIITLYTLYLNSYEKVGENDTPSLFSNKVILF